jgi:hypothetical protein
MLESNVFFAIKNLNGIMKDGVRVSAEHDKYYMKVG